MKGENGIRDTKKEAMGGVSDNLEGGRKSFAECRLQQVQTKRIFPGQEEKGDQTGLFTSISMD